MKNKTFSELFLTFQVNLKMRIRVSYTCQGSVVQDTVQVDSFPGLWTQQDQEASLRVPLGCFQTREMRISQESTATLKKLYFFGACQVNITTVNI